jgi:hypothetical protein
MGQAAADKIAFHGSTAVIQQTTPTVLGTMSAITVSATGWGFSTSTQADGIVAAVNTIRAILNTYGLSA